MNSGKLNERLELRFVVSSSMDIHGQVFPVYGSSSLWAEANTVSGDDQNIGGVDRTYSRYSFTVRKNTLINEDSIIIYNNKTYNIIYIINKFKKDIYTEVIAELIN